MCASISSPVIAPTRGTPQPNNLASSNSDASSTSFNQMLSIEMEEKASANTTPAAAPTTASSSPPPTSTVAKKSTSTTNTPQTDQPTSADEQSAAAQIAVSLVSTLADTTPCTSNEPVAGESTSKAENATSSDKKESTTNGPTIAVATMPDPSSALAILINSGAIFPVANTQLTTTSTKALSTDDAITTMSPSTTNPAQLAMLAAQGKIENQTTQAQNAVNSDYLNSTQNTNDASNAKSLVQSEPDSALTEPTSSIPKGFSLTETPVPLTNAPINSSLPIQNLKTANEALDPAQLGAIAPVLTAPIEATKEASPTIAPRVGTPDWDRAVGQKISWMVAGGQQSASLTLNPPDLGPLQVVLNVHNQHANATFISHQPEVRAALESAIPRLREMMGQSGIQLGECNVNSQSKPQQQGFAQHQGNSNNVINGGVVGSLQPARIARSVGIGMVDTFV